MAYSKAQNKATQKYQKENYERINLAVSKGTKEYYRQEATKQGYTSLNEFIKEAIKEKIERGV